MRDLKQIANGGSMILGTAAMIVMWTVSLVFCIIAFLRGE